MIFIALPFLFVLFVINFPAGLLVYWITTNLWTIVQQTIVRRRLGPLRPPDAEPVGGFGGLGDLLRGGGSSPPDAKKNGDAPRPRARGSKEAEAPKARPAGPPPPSPRKKKKRSGRRR
jgi:YidC/Oxa1 family membrane protein insertase